MVAYLKGSLHKMTYSNYLRAVREVENEEFMELSQNSQSQVIDNTAKPKSTSFFPLQKLKGNQPASKMAAMCLVHLEEESAEVDEEVEIKDPDGIMGIRKSSWCTWHGLQRTPKWRRSDAIIAAALSTLSVTAHW